MLLKYLFIFSSFSIIGWFLEVAYRSVTCKKFINPGFMSGPVVPLYGCGAIILNILCNLFSNINSEYKIFLIFILSIIFLTTLEYFTGYMLLKFFNLRLWDYSRYKTSIKGFICLEFSLIWGLLALCYYSLVFPKISYISMYFISHTYGIFLLGMFLGIFLIDLFVSINLLSNLRKYAKDIKETIDIEKLKIYIRINNNKRKFLNSVYPLVSIKKYLRDKSINKK